MNLQRARKSAGAPRLGRVSATPTMHAPSAVMFSARTNNAGGAFCSRPPTNTDACTGRFLLAAGAGRAPTPAFVSGERVCAADGVPDCQLDAVVAVKRLVAVELGASRGRPVAAPGRRRRARQQRHVAGRGRVLSCRLGEATDGTSTLNQVAEGACPTAQPVGVVGEPGSIVVQ